jgi:hypothetical protein
MDKPVITGDEAAEIVKEKLNISLRPPPYLELLLIDNRLVPVYSFYMYTIGKEVIVNGLTGDLICIRDFSHKPHKNQLLIPAIVASASAVVALAVVFRKKLRVPNI